MATELGCQTQGLWWQSVRCENVRPIAAQRRNKKIRKTDICTWTQWMELVYYPQFFFQLPKIKRNAALRNSTCLHVCITSCIIKKLAHHFGIWVRYFLFRVSPATAVLLKLSHPHQCSCNAVKLRYVVSRGAMNDVWRVAFLPCFHGSYIADGRTEFSSDSLLSFGYQNTGYYHHLARAAASLDAFGSLVNSVGLAWTGKLVSWTWHNFARFHAISISTGSTAMR